MNSALRQAGSWEELIDRVEEIGFLPLFEGPAAGFSAEALTARQPWWSGDPDRDPWFWREAIARSGRVAYGKFFAGKAGFLSLAWLPVLPTGGGRAMTSTPGGTTGWPACGTRSSWTASPGRRSGPGPS